MNISPSTAGYPTDTSISGDAASSKTLPVCMTHDDQNALRKLPDELILAAANVLPARAIFNLGLTNKYLHALLLPVFHTSFQAIENIDKIRTDIVSLNTWRQAMKSLDAVSIEAQKPALLRDVALAYSSLTVDRVDPVNRGISPNSDSDESDTLIFERALKAQEEQIPLPPKSMSDALALVDLQVAGYVMLKSLQVSKTGPVELLLLSNKAFWPAMLESWLDDVPAHALKNVIECFAEGYDGPVVEISSRLAGEVAVAQFFVSDALATQPFVVKRTGPEVLALMHKRFNVSTEAQWDAIDERIATELRNRYPLTESAAFQEECRRWREDVAFLTLVKNGATSV